MSKKNIGVFCGSFNPPLYSHFSLAEQLLNEGLDKIIFVPVSTKYNKENLALDKHRYEMLKLVCNKNPNFEVSDIEFNLPKQPYTIETLLKLQDKYPECEIKLIIGTDNLRQFESWHNVEYLLQKFKVIVLSRNEDNIEEIISQSKLLSAYRSSIIESHSKIKIYLSSSMVRNLIKEGKSVRYLLPDEIIDYIKKNNLYI